MSFKERIMQFLLSSVPLFIVFFFFQMQPVGGLSSLR